MARNSVRGTPYTHIASPSANQGFRQGGSDGSSTQQGNYAQGGINTQSRASGTPARYQHGNPDETRRVVSSDKYGKVISNQQGNANDPNNNGDGVVLDRMSQDYSSPAPAETLDSPVPREAPVFDTGTIVQENAAHLGRGRGPTAPNPAMTRDNLLDIGGVMSRGMVGTSTPGGAEDELMSDDTLPSMPAAGRV